MESISIEQLWATVAVVVALCGVYAVVMNAVKVWREERKLKNTPVKSLEERVAEHDRFFAADKRRIEALESSAKERDEEMQLMLKSMLALLRHGIDGNNIQGLKESQKDIQDFLIGR